jgi:DeoR family suf operon transcriptional repressor
MMTTTESNSTKQDILAYLLKQGQATAQELAEALEISPQATRRHLKDLEGENLIEHQSVQAGMGRPNHLYQLSHQGRERFPNRYRDFAVSFLDALAETGGEEQIKAVLHKQWTRKAESYYQLLGTGSLEDRINKLVQLRQAEGYMTELHLVENSNSQAQFILAEHNCAISEVAESFPSVCGHELEMFAAILPDCKVERTQWVNQGEHSCGYLIQLNN